MLKDYLPIGEVLKPQGLLGLVKIRADMDSPDLMTELKTVYRLVDGIFLPLKTENAVVREGFVYMNLDGATSRDDAEKQRGLILYMARKDAPANEEGRYYIVDLIGCTVFDENDLEIGVVEEVLQPGSNDVYVVKTPEGELLLPALKHVILSVDIQKQKIIVQHERMNEVAVRGD